MTKLYLIRHAEAEGNIYRRMHGQYNSRITPNGLRQIEALRDRFAGVPIDAVYASDLYRARKTAEAIYLPKALPLRPDPRFREVCVGIWEDLPFGQLEREWPEELRLFSREPERWQLPGAESFEAYSGRFEAGLRELAEAHDGQSVAVLTHGCVLSGGLHRILGLPHDASMADNTAVSLLTYENGVFAPVFLFDNSHLSEAISTRARQRWWRQQGGRFNLWFRDPTPADAGLYDPDWTPAPGDRTWIACLGEEAVGYAAVSETGLSVIWLKPEFRHRRFGDQLFGQAVLFLRRKGVTELSFRVPAEAPEALAFFAHLGGVPAETDGGHRVFRMAFASPRPGERPKGA